MTAEPILHYAPDNASLCVRLALLQLEIPFRTQLVDRATRAQKSAGYLALNPNGLIPVLETPQGPIFETAAILLWAADGQQGRAFPRLDDPTRGSALAQLFWLSNTMHPALRMLFYPDTFAGGAAFDARTRDLLRNYFGILERSDLRWLNNNGPSIIACYLAPMIRWCGLYGGDTSWFTLTDYPNLHAFALRFETSPAFLAASKAEGLGRAALTAPARPHPPEGSAL